MGKADAADRHGIINVHKPSGMTSRRVVDSVVRWAETKRVGHAGTLDPLASGVLVICVGWVTRLVSYVQNRPKSYSARFLLGKRSNTDDTTGDVVDVAGTRIPDRAEIEAALSSFTGTIMQTPPQFSAVHVAGVRAYESARQGKLVEVEPRPVVVHKITVREYAWPELALDIDCGSGTYIRSIGRDLGNMLGCGAVMSALVRTAIGEFTLASSVTLEDLPSRAVADSQTLLPALVAVAQLPQTNCNWDECRALLQGKWISAGNRELADAAEVAVVSPIGDLFAIAENAKSSNRLRPRQVFGAMLPDM
jgi:tRNA pseudouridine55 synthase